MAPLVKKKAAVSKRNAAPILNREAFHKGDKSRPFLSITRTDAIIFGAFLAFLLVIALIIYFIMWTANMVTRMQRDHLNQIQQLKRQNSAQVAQEQQLQNSPIPEEGKDEEGSPDIGNQPKLLKDGGMGSRKKEKGPAYGKFEDEEDVDISREAAQKR